MQNGTTFGIIGVAALAFIAGHASRGTSIASADGVTVAATTSRPHVIQIETMSWGDATTQRAMIVRLWSDGVIETSRSVEAFDSERWDAWQRVAGTGDAN